MKRRQRTLVFFTVCAGAVLGAMSWLTVELRALERREARAKADAAFQGSIRTALWRMDSFLAPFLTQEAGRRYFEYAAYFSPDTAITDAGSTLACTGDVLVASQLLRSGEPRFCRLHFQLNADGSLSSPQLPSTSLMQNQTRWNNLSQADVSHVTSLMEALGYIAPPARLTQLASEARDTQKARMIQGDLSHLADEGEVQSLPFTPGQQEQARQELAQRQRNASVAYDLRQSASPSTTLTEGEVEQGALAPVWVGDKGKDRELFLLRTVRIKDEQLIQGVWVNWPDLRDALLARVQDLTPGAELLPCDFPTTEPDQLAGIPAVLVSRSRPATTALQTAVSPISATLYFAWGGVLAALVAVAIVLRAIMELGERRGRFVSAVTHELRTPLTTFCLYSQMLADGMVREEPARREYLTTLKRESQRLARIVENVLGYARLSEVRAAVQTEVIDARDLLDRIVPGLSRRAAEAGMQVVVEGDLPPGVEVRVDPQTVERILANLVDNSCKYALVPSTDDGQHAERDRRIHLRAGVGGGVLEIQVVDHGPGIPAPLRRRAFQAFNRATRDSSNTAPGLGLGLSLARGLARELGGDLRILAQQPSRGAALSLTIPASTAFLQPGLARA